MGKSERDLNEFATKHHQMEHLFLKRFRYLANKNGLYPGQTRILLILNYNKELMQKDLCKIMSIKPASMTDVLQRMEKAGLVERNIDKTDLRITKVSITEQGRKKAEQALKIGKQMEEDCFRKFTKEEKQMFMILMDKFIASLAEAMEEQ